MAFIGVGGVIASIVAGLYRGVARTARTVANDVNQPLVMRLALAEQKLDTVWSFVMRRAEARAVIDGNATMNSPLTFGDDELTWMGALAGPLRTTFHAEWSHIDDDDTLCLAIERRFGVDIQREVCIPHQITDGRCLLIACAVARGAGPP